MFQKQDPVTILPFIGTKQAANLSRIGIDTVGDLLRHFPKYYRDTSEIVTLDELSREQKRTVKVLIDSISSVRIRGGRTLQKCQVSDSSGTLAVTWFNQPFLVKTLGPGTEVLLSGKLNPKSLKPQLVAPEYEVVKERNLHLGKIVPVYPLTRGVGIKWLRTRMADLIENLEQVDQISEPLPDWLLEENQLIGIKEALKGIHLPASIDDIINSRKRLAFEELLGIYTILIKQRQARLKSKAVLVSEIPANLEDDIARLPFKLTPSQVNAVHEIATDLQKGLPMHRLLQGDVGSGKTVVAFLTALLVIRAGYQVVLLAPTTVLAEQHFRTAQKLFGTKLKPVLITSATAKNVKQVNKDELVIATHSILHHQELISDLGFLIVDEQHRFGVKQREALAQLKNKTGLPHVLNMTATPIPRSVALTLFGEIDVSIIEKPEGRLVSQTHLVPQIKKPDSIDWIKAKLTAGGQVFWVCPLIEPQEVETEDEASRPILDGVVESVPQRSVQEVWEENKAIFTGFRVEMLHGKMKNDEKTELIARFQRHEFDMLVATTVIEVGIDIPDANVMVIENAEQYGLAQLHQLRGRVGRNNQESWCFLFTGLENNEQVIERLSFFVRENNGIKVAEFDLENRGPGEVYGTIQSGIPLLKIANFGNSEFLMQVRNAATKLLNYSENK